jgi:multidrug efflux system membrane fusion protein
MILSIRKNAVVIPSSAVQNGQNGKYIFDAKADRTVEIRPVAVGPTLGSSTIIESGLAGEEQVVTDGQLRLVPGAKIISKNAAQQDIAMPQTRS